jgi:hypothetical protein
MLKIVIQYSEQGNFYPIDFFVGDFKIGGCASLAMEMIPYDLKRSFDAIYPTIQREIKKLQDALEKEKQHELSKKD